MTLKHLTDQELHVLSERTRRLTGMLDELEANINAQVKDFEEILASLKLSAGLIRPEDDAQEEEDHDTT